MKIFRFLRRCHLPLLLLLGVFSPALFFLGSSHPQSLWFLAAFPAAYALLVMLLIISPGRARIPLLAIGSALLIGTGYVFFAGSLSLLAMPIVGSAALFFALPYADKSPAETSPFFYMATLIAQLGTLFLLHFSFQQQLEGNALYLLLLCFFVLYLLLLLLAFSRVSLSNASLGRYRLPGIISRVCTLLTVCFFVLALALSSLPAVIRRVYSAFHVIRQGFAQILLFILNLFPVQSEGGPSGAPISMMPGASDVVDQEPSLIFVILEKAAMVLTAIVLLAGCLILARLLLRLLLRLARMLLDRLQHYASAVTEDYEDEITDTRQEDVDRSLSLLRRRRNLRRHEYPDTPAGQIRRSYSRLLRIHSKWKISSTARENLPSSAAEIYERARYSDHPITPEDADCFAQEARNL